MDLPLTLTVVLFAPLASAGLIGAFCRKKGGSAAALSIGACGVSMVLSLLAILNWDLRPLLVAVSWMSLGGLKIEMGYQFDSLAALMLFVVSFVGFWIHLFSAGYMRDDAARGRYFGGLSICMFSMLGIVLAGNLFMLFIFWELIGFSSYMLIGHYFEKPLAAAASKKAFIVNRVGDFGFLIGIILCYWHFGTVNISELGSLVAANPESAVTVIGLCLFCGVLGKSAQMPLHVWLPDAMEGPTPASALINAATVVAAGVYFLCRVYFLFSVDALCVIMWVGTVTAIYAAFCALAQSDIKRVLAYSTLSQSGYMVAVFALGTRAGMGPGAQVGAMAGVAAAMFHLTTHAFFNALLFLGSGSVIDACHHEQDIFRMGGLAKRMKITFGTFTIGVIAISGVPWIGAGFYSKDAMLFLALKNNMAVFSVLGFTALLTAFYMGRIWVIAFLGDANSDDAEHAKESPWTMTLPLVILGALSTLLGGSIALYPEGMQGVLADLARPHGADEGLMIGLLAGCSLIGLVGAWIFYRPGARVDRLQNSVPGAFAVLRSKLLFDEIYDWYVAKVQRRGADILGVLDQLLISGLMVRGSAGLAALVGLVGRATHVGSIHGYVYWFLAGMIVYWGFAVGWF